MSERHRAINSLLTGFEMASQGWKQKIARDQSADDEFGFGIEKISTFSCRV